MVQICSLARSDFISAGKSGVQISEIYVQPERPNLNGSLESERAVQMAFRFHFFNSESGPESERPVQICGPRSDI